MSRMLVGCLVAGVCLAGVAGWQAAQRQRASTPQNHPTPPSDSTTAPALPGNPTSAPALLDALDLVPADSLLCWYARPFPDVAPSPDQPSALETLVSLGTTVVGPALNAEARLWARAIEAFGVAIRFRHALVLIDAHAVAIESNPQIKRADRIRFALIVETHGDNAPFARVLQAAINEQTDQGAAIQSLEQAGPWSYIKLLDRRLPEWCTIAWGRLDQYFVFTVGPEVWPEIAAVAAGQAPALGRAEWLAGAREQRGRDALIEIIVASQDIRDRLDPVVDGRATDFFNAWHAQEIERAHWALGFEGRAMYCVAHFLEHGRTREYVYADPDIRAPHLLALMPDDARYAIYRVNPQEVIPSFFSGLLATRSPADQHVVRELWARIQAQHGFDADRDILAHLGRHIVMHNYPPHPLRIPLAMTTLTEISGTPETVRRTVDTICSAWREEQLKLNAQGDDPNAMRVELAPGGIWCVRFGWLDGPAWTVTDKYIITSWSPAALRTYLDNYGNHVGTRPAAGRP